MDDDNHLSHDRVTATLNYDMLGRVPGHGRFQTPAPASESGGAGRHPLPPQTPPRSPRSAARAIAPPPPHAVAERRPGPAPQVDAQHASAAARLRVAADHTRRQRRRAPAGQPAHPLRLHTALLESPQRRFAGAHSRRKPPALRPGPGMGLQRSIPARLRPADPRRLRPAGVSTRNAGSQ